MKRPSFQFYPGDWINDAALRLVSVGARGAWIDMLCLMHQGTPYGHLKVNHKVILAPNLARILGATLPETEGWLDELREAGVFDEADDGGIFSRRMVRDEELRQVRAAGGKKGGNPALIDKKKDNCKVGDKVNLPPNLQPTPSSSSSSSNHKSSSASPDGDTPASSDSIPYQAIVTAYNSTMANLAKVREVTPKRRTLIRSAWQASPQRRNLEFWRDAYFPECQDDAFLNGTGPYTSGHENWRPTFDYLMRPDVVTRVFERAMDRLERAQ